MKRIKKVISLTLIFVFLITSMSLNVLAKNDKHEQSQNQAQVQNDSNNANENAAKVHKQKAEEELSNWVLPDLIVLEGEYFADYRKAQKLYYEGLRYEGNEHYKEAKDAYQESWKLLKNKSSNLEEINTTIDEIKNNSEADYDNDGLLNGFEIEAFYGCMNPLLPDTDSDGINDGNEDYEIDGLTNLEEQLYSKNPNKD